MSSSTLVSLAMLRVNSDQHRDYLEYLRPFILDILVNESLKTTTVLEIHSHLLARFGLNIPEPSVHILLKRIARKHGFTKEDKVYTIPKGFSVKSNITIQKSEAERHIQAVVSGLIEFSQDTNAPIDSEDRKKATDCLIQFLSKFNILCLRAYLRGTALPNIHADEKTYNFLVGKYILHLQQIHPERFESFMILMQGHMMANALTCPDLAQVPDTYRRVTFFLDTPILIQLLGLDTKYKKNSIKNLIELLGNLKGKFAVFSHVKDELKVAIDNAANNLENPENTNSIVREARNRGKTKSDLLLFAEKIDDKLSEFKIVEEITPQYNNKNHNLQIDESAFESVLKAKVLYYSQKARENDINSVRSIYVLRKGLIPRTVEKSKAILVTSNTQFAKAAWQYGQEHEETKQVSSVITSFSLANMAWLKAPMGANSLPEIEVLAFAYAALRPSKELLDKYLKEIERLKREGDITPKDHQLLRNYKMDKELMNSTMGDEKIVNKYTIQEVLTKIENKIKEPEVEKFETEKKKHEQTKKALLKEKNRIQKMKNRSFWNCKKRAKRWSWFLFIIIVIIIVLVIYFISGNEFVSSFVGFLIPVINVLGIKIPSLQIRKILESQLFHKWFLKRAEKIIGLTLDKTNKPLKGK